MRELVLIVAVSLGLTTMVARAAAAEPQPPFKLVTASEDVAWLEKIAGSLDAAAELGPKGGLAANAKDLRTTAYARLGALGTPEALAAIRRIEAQAKNLIPAPERVPVGIWPGPGWLGGDQEVKPIGPVVAKDGTTYAFVQGSILGSVNDLFLISTKTPNDPASWARPKLILVLGLSSLEDPQTKLTESEAQQYVELRYRQETTVWIQGVQRDSDGDGWTDFEEERLGLNPKNPDSDGDGLKDGDDACPDYAPTAKDAADEEVQIFQKAIFATFGLSGSRHLVIVGPGSKKVQLWGHAGPVLYRPEQADWRARHGYGAVFVNWKIEKKTNTEAVVGIDDWEGELAAGDQNVILKKIGGEWFVVERKTGGVS